MRELREEFKRYKNAERSRGVQCEPASEEGRLEEDEKMEVGEEVDSKKKLDERKKRLQRQFREMEKFTDTEQKVVDEHKEKWQQELQDIEQKRNDLLPEHQRGLKSCKVCRAKRSSARRTLENALVTWSRSETKSWKERFSSFFFFAHELTKKKIITRKVRLGTAHESRRRMRVSQSLKDSARRKLKAFASVTVSDRSKQRRVHVHPCSRLSSSNSKALGVASWAAAEVDLLDDSEDVQGEPARERGHHPDLRLRWSARRHAKIAE